MDVLEKSLPEMSLFSTNQSNILITLKGSIIVIHADDNRSA